MRQDSCTSRGCSSMVEPLSSKQITRVRFPSAPPFAALPLSSELPGILRTRNVALCAPRGVRAQSDALPRARGRGSIPVSPSELRNAPPSVGRLAVAGLMGIEPCKGRGQRENASRSNCPWCKRSRRRREHCRCRAKPASASIPVNPSRSIPLGSPKRREIRVCITVKSFV